ncbi:DUF2391 family protein [Halorarum halobium]|uniref:DUF2391 family protein n=1 Tax=Halorarum halobium TaxID=3075121 RepID=UPI0028AA6F1C|nr:DUF2391 family protein [Halobaculum sp. XH14]
MSDGTAGPTADTRPTAGDGGTDGDPESEPTVDDLLDQLETLEETVDEEEEVAKVRDAMRTATKLSRPTVFGRIVHGFDRGDIAEALLGSIIFGVPMLVEGGTQEVGAHLATHPAYLVGTFVVTVAAVVGIVYVADFQDVRVDDPFLGVVPRRLVGVLGVALAVAVLGLTAWGRITWAEPMVALGNVVAALLPMAVGGALGDLLPG